MNLPIAGYTDYPIVEFGDKPYSKAKIRAVKLLAYDGNKYAEVEVFDGVVKVKTEIKAGYLYSKPGRFVDDGWRGEDGSLYSFTGYPKLEMPDDECGG